MAINYTDKNGTAHAVNVWDSTRKRVSYDNEKTGIWSINLLAGDMGTRYGGSVPAYLQESMCTGTCSGTCPGCYALKMTRYTGVALKYLLNTLEARENPARFISLVEGELFGGHPLTHPRVLRIHDSGDFFSLEYLSAWMDCAARHPSTVFGFYTKAGALFERYGIDDVYRLGNVSPNCSPWRGVSEPIGDMAQFIYDDGTDPDVARLPHCPAVSKDGKRTGVKCVQCLHCYTAKRGERWAVYPH